MQYIADRDTPGVSHIVPALACQTVETPKREAWFMVDEAGMINPSLCVADTGRAAWPCPG